MLLNQDTVKNLPAIVRELPKRFQHAEFDNFDDKTPSLRNAKIVCEKFYQGKLPKEGLFICGEIGVGKTHLAVSTLKRLPSVAELKYLRRAVSVFLSADEFFMKLNDAINSKRSKLEIIKDYLTNNDVLCIDDLSIKNFSDAKLENFYTLINYAYMNKRKMIITTNYSLDDLANYDERIASRIYEICNLVMIQGDDYRISDK